MARTPVIGTPRSITRFCGRIVPLLARTARGAPALRLVRQILETDRWNSFDAFRRTNRTIRTAFRAAGAESEITAIPTGGPLGTGRWIMQQAWDVEKAVAEVVNPVRRKLLDYRDNPFHVAQLSGSTPRGGITCDLVILDDREEIRALRPGALTGKIVLTRLMPYPFPYNQGQKSISATTLFERGAAAVITDASARGRPDAVAWSKLGWGQLRLGEGSARLPAMVISQEKGKELRKLVGRGKPVRVRADVQVRTYAGALEAVSGLVLGRDDPQSEVWAIAHSAEPGAVDNASGIAVCVEVARVIEKLIAEGKLPRPRRTIRLVAAYECFGFFGYLEKVRRYQPPLAGVCIDAIGLRPELCERTLQWHATIPPSAGFVDALGEKIIRAALRRSKSGYRFKAGKFVSTDDTLIGDPHYGFPCPWFTTGLYSGYHSSADTPKFLHPPGLAASAAAMAGYLYYLADMATPEALELAEWRTEEALAALRGLGKRPPRADAEFLRARHAEDMRRLSRWLWGGEHSEARGRLLECERRLSAAAGRPARSSATHHAHETLRVPRRTAPLTPSLENVPAELCGALAGPIRWAHYWADGRRTIAEIARLASGEFRREVSAEKLARGFHALEKLGFVEIDDPENAVGHAELVRGLKRLGLRRGMDLIVHSAMSAIGNVEGGADSVVDAMLEVVGPRGTVMMPTFSHGAARVFNPLATPGKSGAVTEAFWRRPEAVRSVHPTHPVAAIGPRAVEWCAGHTEAGVWGEDSPIGRLVRGGGFILCIGVGHGSSTARHLAEVAAGKCIDQFAGRGRVVDADGRVREVPSLAWRDGKCPVSPAKLEEALERRGLRRKGTIGGAEATLVLGRDLYKLRRQHLRRACPGCSVRPENAAKTAKRRGGGRG